MGFLQSEAHEVRDLGLVQNPLFYSASKYPFFCVAEKDGFIDYIYKQSYCKLKHMIPLRYIFRAYTRKGGYVLGLSLELLLNPRSCPCGHPCGVRLRGIHRSAQDDACLSVTPDSGTNHRHGAKR